MFTKVIKLQAFKVWATIGAEDDFELTQEAAERLAAVSSFPTIHETAEQKVKQVIGHYEFYRPGKTVSITLDKNPPAEISKWLKGRRSSAKTSRV